MTRFMLDADFAIYASEGSPEALAWFAAHGAEHISMSAIVRAQLEAGAAAIPSLAADRRRALSAIAAVVATEPFPEEAAVAYGRIVDRLGFSRRYANDRMIAAHAIVLGAALVTNNAKDFVGIDGLVLERWR